MTLSNHSYVLLNQEITYPYLLENFRKM